MKKVKEEIFTILGKISFNIFEMNRDSVCFSKEEGKLLYNMLWEVLKKDIQKKEYKHLYDTSNK